MMGNFQMTHNQGRHFAKILGVADTRHALSTPFHTLVLQNLRLATPEMAPMCIINANYKQRQNEFRLTFLLISARQR